MTKFLDKLKKVSKNAKSTSIRLYHQNVKRLYRLIKEDFEELPDTGSWLKKDALMTKLKKIPVNKRRHLSLAGLKACYALKVDDKTTAIWFDQMKKDGNDYQEQREKNVASDKEKRLLPKDGIKSLKIHIVINM